MVVASNRRCREDVGFVTRGSSGGVPRGAVQRSRRPHRHARGGSAGQRDRGVGLGGHPMWTVEHDTALEWAFRATATRVEGVHLDVEPWALPRWREDARPLMVAYATLVEEMTEVAPLAVDIVPWLVGSHREAVSRVVRQCDSLTVLAYRDRAVRILDDVRGIQEVCEARAVATGSAWRRSRRRHRYQVPPHSATTARRCCAGNSPQWPPESGMRCSTGSPFTTSAPGGRCRPDRLIDPGRVASVPIKMLSPRPSST